MLPFVCRWEIVTMRLLRRLSHWIRLRANHAELVDELAFHRDMVERDLVRRGLSPEDAAIRGRIYPGIIDRQISPGYYSE